MVVKKTLHPSVQEFKVFMQKNPHLMKDVDENRKTLQSLYEDWAVLGEDHEQWQPLNNENLNNEEAVDEEEVADTPDTFSSVMSLMNQLNVEEIQSFLVQLSAVLENVQGVMQIFQQTRVEREQQEHDFPFSFKQD